MKKLTILVPGIRTHNWLRFYNSVVESASNLDWEILFVSPFGLPIELENIKNVRCLKSYSTVSICLQLGMKEAKGELVFHTVDDSILYPDALNDTIDFYNNVCSYKDIVNARYREGMGDGQLGQFEFPMSYWKVNNYYELRLSGINQSWEISVQPIVNRNYFIQLGGFDCRFEYSNHCHHDFVYRVQKDGGKIYHSTIEVSNTDHLNGREGDHWAIYDSQVIHDTPLFNELYKEYDDRIVIDYDNYKQYPDYLHWKRRFGDKQISSYEELSNVAQT